MRSVPDNWWLVVNYCNALTERALAGTPARLRDWRANNKSTAFKAVPKNSPKWGTTEKLTTVSVGNAKERYDNGK